MTVVVSFHIMEVEMNEKSVVTVGTFDGVHRGHLEVLKTLREAAETCGAIPTVITFDRHPAEILVPGHAPQLITSIEERDDLLRKSGVEVSKVIFDSNLCKLTASEWIKRLHDDYGAVAVVIGYDNKFGCDGRNLNFEDFVDIGTKFGIQIIKAPMIEAISSTTARRAIIEGNMERAADILGRRFSVSGEVVHGRQLGRTIGVPTANIMRQERLILPAPGVYAARVEYNHQTYAAVVNVGNNPTVDGSGPDHIEAHLLDFKGDLYGKIIRIEFITKIRDQLKFDSLASLKSRIEQDIQHARKIVL